MVCLFVDLVAIWDRIAGSCSIIIELVINLLGNSCWLVTSPGILSGQLRYHGVHHPLEAGNSFWEPFWQPGPWSDRAQNTATKLGDVLFFLGFLGI